MITMDKKMMMLFASVLTVIFFFTSCASTPSEPVAKELEGTVKSEVLEHKGSALGLNELPVWVETYILTGITGLEELPDYTGDYCFVAETSANDVNAAQAWVNGFDMPQTIARNVSTRVDGVFSGAATGSAEGAYGTYFENVVKAATEIEYSGAKKENDWWVLTRRYDTDIKSKYKDEYRAYVLYTIPRDLLDQQVLTVIDRVAQESSVDAGQEAAIDKVKNLISDAGL